MPRWMPSAALVFTMLMAAAAWPAELDMVLAPPKEPARGGEAITLLLYLHNHGDDARVVDLPASLPCSVETGRTTVVVDARLVDGASMPSVAVPGNGIALRRYRLQLPLYAAGPVRIAPRTLDTNPLTVQVDKAPPEAWIGQQVPLDEGPTMLQSFLDDLSVYEPMYFLLGVDPGLDQSKFQFSFKYR